MKRYFVTFCAISLAAAACIFYRPWHAIFPATKTGGGEGSPEQAATTGFRAGNAGEQLPTPAPTVLMPPPEAPLKTAIAALAELSKGGNVTASLRLFKDLQACDLRRASRHELDEVYFHHRGESDLDYQRRLAKIVEGDFGLERAMGQLEKTDALCDGITPAQIDSRAEYLRQAALHDDQAALVCYLAYADIGPSYLSDPWFDYASRWRDEAPSLAQRALDIGAPGILELLIDAYLPDDSNIRRMYSLSQVLEPDAELAYAFSIVYVRDASGAELQQAQNSLSNLLTILQPRQVADAQAIADELAPRFQTQAVRANTFFDPCRGLLPLPPNFVTDEQLAP